MTAIPEPYTTTSVFESGNSQAVRIPNEFRLASSKVAITRVGKSLVLTPEEPSLLDVIEDITSDRPEGWTSSMEEPEDFPPEPIEQEK